MKSPFAKLAFLTVCAAAIGAAIGYQMGRPQRAAEVPAPISAPPPLDAEASATLADAPRQTGDAALGEFTSGAFERLPFRDRMELALSYESHRKQAYAVELLFEDMERGEAPAILEILMQEPDNRKRRGMLRPFFLKWGQLDGEVALETARGLEGREKTDALSASLAGWGESDPYRAWEAARGFLDESMRQSYVVRGAYQELAKRDMGAALEALSDSTDQNLLRTLGGALVGAAFESEQVDGLLSGLESVGDLEQRKGLIGQIFRRWGEEDTNAPMDALARIGDAELAKEAMTGFLQGWIQSDRDGAIDYAIENRNDPTFSDSLGAVFRQAFFAGGESENRELVARLSGEGLLDSIARDVVSSLSFNQPELAMEVASAVSDPDHRKSFQSQAFHNWARRDFDSAMAHYGAVEDPSARANLTPAVLSTLSRRADGGELLKSVFNKLPASRERTEAVESALAMAASPYAKNLPAYLESLEAVVASESGLSEKALENYAKLFGKE